MADKTLQEQGIFIVDTLCSIFTNKYRLTEYMSKEDLEDMKQDAMVMMLDKINGFEEQRGNQLSTYLTPRINGFFLDYLRRQGNLKRIETKHFLELVDREVNRVLSLNKDHATEKLEELGVTNDNVKELLRNFFEDETYELFDSIRSLPDVRIYILLGYYVLDKSVKDMNKELGYADDSGRAYQMKRESLIHLRNMLTERGILTKEIV